MPETDVRAEVLEADLSVFSVRAVDARTDSRDAATVAELRAQAGAIAAINGTFFDDDVRPLGLLIDDGQQLSPLRKADWGVLWTTRSGNAAIMHTRDWPPQPSVEFAVQCGPRVVIGGSIPTLKPQIARRAAACVQSPTSLALIVTREVIEAQTLARWLAAPAPAGLGCTDALLLDGGPSAQLDAQQGEWSVSIVGGWPVPNAIALVPR